ncbi:MAG TPA: nuclear transport factor 2 family protein [Thermoanaerobaculia bacterium]|nr:nuclear transport factor 2 family protein [Thermoanaerobaculia bacterium]
MGPLRGGIVMAMVFVATADGAGREPSDEAKILEHIHGIFQAYIRQDRAEIERRHTRDWIGFQGPSAKIERGIEDYMINADRSLNSFQGTGYELLDTEVQLFGDVALVWYVARYDYRSLADGSEGTLHLRSVDVYSRRNGEWNQSGSHIAVIPSGGSWGEGKTPESGSQ